MAAGADGPDIGLRRVEVTTYIPCVLEKIGYRPELGRWASARDALLGRVARAEQGILVVLSERGPLRCSYGGGLLATVAADPGCAPCTGDWCVVREWPHHRLTVERVLPRRTCVTEATSGQAVCANADLVAAVVALDPSPRPAELERLVSQARDSGARPLVVLTKADIVADPGRQAAALALDVEVVCTSAVTGAGTARLRQLIGGGLTLALLGPDGHGKSSLVDALVGARVLPTRTDGNGRPATARHELVPLPGGGAVLDTSGTRAQRVARLHRIGGGRA